MWESETSLISGRDYGNGVHSTSKHGVKTDSFEQKGQSWYVATDIPSDLLVQIEDVAFHFTQISLDELPGGPEAFELAAKGYVMRGNLIFKIEALSSYVGFIMWEGSILVLRAVKSYHHGQKTYKSFEDADASPSRNQQVPPDWWFEDVSILRIDHFVRVITAIKVKGMRHELLGASIMQYAAKWLPGLIKEGSGLSEDGSNSSNSNGSKGQRLVYSFLLRLSRIINMLKVAPALITELEKRVGMQFEQATLADLLTCHLAIKVKPCMTLILCRGFGAFLLVQEQTESSDPGRYPFSDNHMHGDQRNFKSKCQDEGGETVDSYLTEVSRDRNLSLTIRNLGRGFARYSKNM
ncbi:hypothetical protein HAX54_036800 [Datura stramonium]|uniref:NPH3 domain-containing protein n=1 Tax=Datura stramonium TaxID=4076 RepID=A0ABS8RMG7_DATST|nr:hypothetical protein [Datura stramonium]